MAPPPIPPLAAASLGAECPLARSGFGWFAMITIWSWPGKIKVVEVGRRLASPRRGERQSSTEYQVRHNNAVVSRHDLRNQARDSALIYIEKAKAA